MKQLWAPWRMEFIDGPKPNSCVFCAAAGSTQDRDHGVLKRTAQAFIILNKYPYNNGHLMVVPFSHTNELSKLPPATLQEIMELSRESMEVLARTLKAPGFNLGMNLGEAAGAGIRDHLHMHIVPRWVGDTNFMPVIADTKSMPQHLLESYDVLANAFGSDQ